MKSGTVMNKILMVAVVTVAAGLVLAATAWNFSTVAAMPTKYVEKEPHVEQHQRIENKLDKIYDIIIKRGD